MEGEPLYFAKRFKNQTEVVVAGTHLLQVLISRGTYVGMKDVHECDTPQHNAFVRICSFTLTCNANTFVSQSRLDSKSFWSFGWLHAPKPLA